MSLLFRGDLDVSPFSASDLESLQASGSARASAEAAGANSGPRERRYS